MVFRALHWVTIQMLCVPVDEEIPEVSDSVVKAITGESARMVLLSFSCYFSFFSSIKLSSILFCLPQISSRWTPSVCPGINLPASPVAASISSVLSESPRTNQLLQMTSYPPSSILCWRPTRHGCSPTSSTSHVSATLQDSWPERTDTTSPTW